jgi:hypothetical protein
MADLAVSILQAVVMILVVFFLIYMVYRTYQYQNAPCSNKIPLWMYLTSTHRGMCLSDKSEKGTEMRKDKNILSLWDAPSKDEVFFISNQTYNYDEAVCKCKGYGGRLATKAELTEAYNKGAHWCDYGWVQGRQAFYPVQSCEIEKKVANIKEYNRLLVKHYEDSKKYPMSMVNEARDKMNREGSTEFCGTHAGLNGGVFDDPHVRFGVTCYGQKPKGTTAREKQAICKDSLYGKESDDEKAKRLEKCKPNPDEDRIVGFNLDQWSQPDL